jgi:competence protein ComEC
VAPGAEAVAVRGANGKLHIMKVGSDTFALREWLAADADARTAGDPHLKEGFTCDEIGCIARLADGSMVAVALAAEAFEEDCRRVALVISRRTAPPGCAAMVIDRTVWPRTGAAALVRSSGGFVLTAARPPGYDRPWARPPADPSVDATAQAPGAAPPRDATPREEDLRPED